VPARPRHRPLPPAGEAVRVLRSPASARRTSLSTAASACLVKSARSIAPIAGLRDLPRTTRIASRHPAPPFLACHLLRRSGVPQASWPTGSPCRRRPERPPGRHLGVSRRPDRRGAPSAPHWSLSRAHIEPGRTHRRRRVPAAQSSTGRRTGGLARPRSLMQQGSCCAIATPEHEMQCPR